MTQTRKRASEIRKRLKEIPDELREDLDALLPHRDLFKGYVYRSHRRCGKPSCRCTRGELHEAWIAVTNVDGKRTTRSLSDESRKKLLSLASDYRRFRQARSSLRRRCDELMKLARELEKLMYVKPFDTKKTGKARKGR